MYDDKYIKTRIKTYHDGIYKNFQHNKIPKDNKYCACLSVILSDSIFVHSIIQIKNVVPKYFWKNVNMQ